MASTLNSSFDAAAPLDSSDSLLACLRLNAAEMHVDFSLVFHLAPILVLCFLLSSSANFPVSDLDSPFKHELFHCELEPGQAKTHMLEAEKKRGCAA